MKKGRYQHAQTKRLVHQLRVLDDLMDSEAVSAAWQIKKMYLERIYHISYEMMQEIEDLAELAFLKIEAIGDELEILGEEIDESTGPESTDSDQPR